MKKTIFLLLLSVTFRLHAQECANSQDCLSKGIATYYNTPAIEFMDKALKLAKKEGVNPAEIYFQRGIKYYNHNEIRIKEAEKDFNNAIEANPQHFWAHMWLAGVYAYKQQDLKKATDFLTTTLTKFNNDPRIYYERSQFYKWYNQTGMAATDMEMAYNLLLDDASQVDEGRRADIVLWHAQFYMLNKGIHVADEKVLKILETGAPLAPTSSKLTGALALAYYDLDNMAKAGELGEKANQLGSNNTGGQLFASMKELENKNYQAAYERSLAAKEADISGHPMVHYMFALSHWEYLVAKFPNAWNSYKDGIRQSLETCYYNGKGTKYDQYASWAGSNIDKVR